MDSKKTRIKKAVKTVGIENDVIVSIKDMENASKVAGVSLYDIMHYLRFEREVIRG